MTARTIDGYVIDCIVEESVSYQAEVSEYPVESGATITDHVQNAAPTVTFSAVVSDTPIGEAASARTANAVPSSEARAFLLALRDERRPFTFVGTTGTYDLMVFASLEFPRDGETGAALRIEAELRQLTLAEVKRTVVRTVQRLGHRPSRSVDGPPMWLCPDLLVVSNDPAANLAKKCRKVVQKNDGLYFADNGAALNLAQLTALGTQRITGAGGGQLDASGNGDFGSRLAWDEERGWVNRSTYASGGDIRAVDMPLTPAQAAKVREFEAAEAARQGLPDGYVVDERNGDYITGGRSVPNLGL